MNKKELSNLKQVAKKIVPSKTLSKIKKIKDKDEQLDLYKHSIKSNLHLQIADLEKEINSSKKKNDIFHLEMRSNLLNLKIKYFYITHRKKDLKNILSSMKKIKKELKSL